MKKSKWLLILCFQLFFINAYAGDSNLGSSSINSQSVLLNNISPNNMAVVLSKSKKCPPQSMSWTANNNQCTGLAPETDFGSDAVITNTQSGTVGGMTLTCNNGAWILKSQDCSLSPVARTQSPSIPSTIIHPQTGVDITSTAWPAYASLIGKELIATRSTLIPNPNEGIYDLEYCVFKAFVNDYGLPQIIGKTGNRILTNNNTELVKQIMYADINQPGGVLFEGEYAELTKGLGHRACFARLSGTGIDIGKDAGVRRLAWSDNIVVNNEIDTEAPELTITSPVEDAIVNGIVTIYANASDNKGIDYLVVNNVYNMSLSEKSHNPPYSMSLDTSREYDGARSFYVDAVDTSGNVTRKRLQLELNNHKANITSPYHGKKITRNETISVSVDSGVTFTTAKLYIDGILVKSSSTRSFTYSWLFAAISPGQHELKVVLTESLGGGATKNHEMSINVTR